MKQIALVTLMLLAGCASYSGSSLVPGQSSAADVEAVMGAPRERTRAPNGETVLWYSRQPYGRENFAARIAPDGRLIAIEPRLTEENIARIQPNSTRRDEVLDILGPPFRVEQFARLQREIWEYNTPCRINCMVLYVQIAPDGMVREVYHLLDPVLRPDGGFEPT